MTFTLTVFTDTIWTSVTDTPAARATDSLKLCLRGARGEARTSGATVARDQ